MNLKEEDKIRRAFKPKNWNEIKTYDSWQIFKIMAEFVQGFERLGKIGPCVSVFGSARTRPSDIHYKYAEEVAYLLTKKGYGIITGGGPGIMEAANKGAHFAGGRSVGLNITLPFEQDANPFIDPENLIEFDFFFVRKVMFMKYAQGFIVLPGGFGTFEEIFEAITWTQLGIHDKACGFLNVRGYFDHLIKFVEHAVDQQFIHAHNRSLVLIDDNPEKLLQKIESFEPIRVDKARWALGN